MQLLDLSSRSRSSALSRWRSAMSCTGFLFDLGSFFKQCLLVRSCIAGSAPSYLAELCVPVSSVAGRQSLRSASQGTLEVPRVRTERYGRRGFFVSGPHVWNLLLPRICFLVEKPDLFKRELKHHLMQQHS